MLQRARAAMAPWSFTLFRVAVGGVMAAHGWLKLEDLESWTGSLKSMGVPAPEVMAWLSVGGELLGGAGLAVGLLTPLAAFGVAATMAMAIFKVHWKNGLFGKDGGFEYPMIVMFSALYFMMQGGGRYSLDTLVARFRKRRRG